MLRFRDLGASFSSFGCFVLRSSFSSASFSKLPNMAAMLSCENTIPFIISDRISHLIGVNFHAIMPST